LFEKTDNISFNSAQLPSFVEIYKLGKIKAGRMKTLPISKAYPNILIVLAWP